MAKYLVIVESPAKSKTITKFLGKNYKVQASIGHVRDLPKSKMGIDMENDFDPQYITIRGKGSVIKELKSAAKKVDKVFLATDPDREGEAIAWHLANILGIDIDEKCRVTFHEITKDAIKEAVKNPRAINMDLVDAQQGRRILDRLVGYSISPLLWRKIRKGLSAGRVQSVATKLICDREKLIDAFIPEEYWTIDAELKKAKHRKKIVSTLHSYNGKKLEIKNEKEVNDILKEIKDYPFVVSDIKTRGKSRTAPLPFTTSSLQQEAANKLGFSTKKTMSVAQQLYEGVDIKKNGTVGLITYMRTDSTRISDEARNHGIAYIEENYGQEYLGVKKKAKKESKNAQDAHEAVRPTVIHFKPEEIESSLNKDQFKLYKLIWERFMSSLMSNAKFETKTVSFDLNAYEFRLSGTTMVFDGFLKVYTYASTKDTELPELEVGEELELKEILPLQHFTQPPGRYTEASLVKEMEEKGIGRPSTYAPTISTIISRGYVEREKKALKPTELGNLINDIMENYFNNIVDVSFTADLEHKLDNVEDSNYHWKELIREFYGPFKALLDHAEGDIEKVDLVEETDIECDKCGNMMVIKYGRFGKFLACSNYPECKNTKAILKEIGVKCPKCEVGEVVERKTKKFRTFYGCSEFPDCNFMSWNKPTNQKCPECGEILYEKRTKKMHSLICDNCDYKKELSED
ncbi:MAG: type I DNA topoisomerase [Firmicutes bacterium]|jgi:DNA topoisomerase-1|nr:type I DNA topoisomerase [Bacillota bacterium]